MSSPPYAAGSPPPAVNPRKRPSVVTTPNLSHKRRKPSLAPSGSSSAHPLRQASFPPAEPESLSPQSRNASFSPAVDGAASVSSFGANKSAKSKAKGRSKKSKGGDTAAPSVANDDKASSARGPAASSSARAQAERDDDDDDEDDDDIFDGAEEMDAAARATQGERRAILYEKLTRDQADRYDIWNRNVLKRQIVKKIANQTVSQSVPQSIVLTIGICAKMFLGDVIEKARDVQMERLAAAEGLPTGETKKKKKKGEEVKGVKVEDGDVKMEEAREEEGGGEEEEEEEGRAVDATLPFFDVQERDRGPLTPDHVREALRRYKKDREGGSAGLQGLSLHGREAVASRVGGRRLFR